MTRAQQLHSILQIQGSIALTSLGGCCSSGGRSLQWSPSCITHSSSSCHVCGFDVFLRISNFGDKDRTCGKEKYISHYLFQKFLHYWIGEASWDDMAHFLAHKQSYDIHSFGRKATLIWHPLSNIRKLDPVFSNETSRKQRLCTLTFRSYRGNFERAVSDQTFLSPQMNIDVSETESKIQ